MTDLPLTNPAGLRSADIERDTVDGGALATGLGTALAALRNYTLLMKPRVMSLVVFTGFVGMMMAPAFGGAGADFDPVTAVIALLCIAVGAGASGALNMWYDADIDAKMSRTCARPIPAGRVKPVNAMIFGLILSVLSVGAMGLWVNPMAAFLLGLTIAFYVAVYTMWLKRWTAQNIVIGGIAGALPPVIGWAALTGGVAVEPLVLFLIIFLWTPPHFWALALFRTRDYAKAGVPMLPVVSGGDATRGQILAYTLALAVSGLLPVWLGFAGYLYTAVSVVLGGLFIGRAVRLWHLGREAEKEAGRMTQMVRLAQKLFAFSIFYLFCLFLALLIERVLGMVPFGG